MPRESGLSSDPACAEPDNRCADTRTANKFATPLVFGDLISYAEDGKALAAIASKSERA